MTTRDFERPGRSERKARGFGHVRRAELLAAAERIFRTEGYEGATIRRIAEEVGVSSTALYMYFQDKSEIMLQICVGALEALEAEQAALDRAPFQAEARLRAMLEAMLAFGRSHPTAYQLLYCPAPRDVSERRHAVTGALSQRCFVRVQGAVEAAIASGALRGDIPARALTEALVAACHGVICMRLANPEDPWSDPDVLSRSLLDSLFQGVQAA